MLLNCVDVEIKNCSKVLLSGGTLLYPTDTVWGIGCDATNLDAVSKVYNIKQRGDDSSFILLLDRIENISKYVEYIPPIAYDLISAVNKTPITIIYPKGKNLAKNVLGADGSIAIRIVNNDFCKRLIAQIDRPIVSTSANLSGEPTPLNFSNISQYVMDAVDHIAIVDNPCMSGLQPSRIIKLEADGMFTIIRE